MKPISLGVAFRIVQMLLSFFCSLFTAYVLVDIVFVGEEFSRETGFKDLRFSAALTFIAALLWRKYLLRMATARDVFWKEKGKEIYEGRFDWD